MTFARFAPVVLAAAVFLSGCVLVPTGTVVRKASLDKVQVAIALPTDTDLDTYTGGTPWNRARLTLSRNDGAGSDLVQPLEGVKGGLKAKAPLSGLEPGSFYRVDLELIYDDPSGLERIVARGALGATEADVVTLKPGSNSLKVPVAPTLKGDTIALEPTLPKKVTKTKTTITLGDKLTTRTTNEDDEDDEDEDGDEVTLIGTIIGVVGAIVEAAQKK